MQDNYKIFIGTSVHRWNDNRIFHKEAVSLAKKFNVELHAPADFDKKKINGVNNGIVSSLRYGINWTST